MKKTIRYPLSITLVISLLVAALFSYSSANAAGNFALKYSEDLVQAIEKSSEAEQIGVYVWFDPAGIDHEALVKQAETETGITEKSILELESSIPPIGLTLSDLELPDDEFWKIMSTYAEETQELRLKELDMVYTRTGRIRELSREAYKEYNNKNASAINLNAEQICFVSEYTPCVIAKLTRKEIFTLAQHELVAGLGYRPILEEISPSIAVSLARVEANYVRNTLGFNGYGVKLGLNDTTKQGPHSELPTSRFIVVNTGGSTGSHATAVSRVMAGNNGYANAATVYVNHANDATLGEYEKRIEELISKNVSVINQAVVYSRSSATNYYGDQERWTDHVSTQHSVSVVIPANNEPNQTIWSPGLAYNPFTICAIDTKDTSSFSDDVFASYNSTANGGTAGCAKPEFTAPTVNSLGGGTSLAAPAITGMLGQLISWKPSFAAQPQLLKAILEASCTDKFSGETMVSNLTAKEGSGLVNLRKAVWIIDQGRYAYGTTTGSYTKNFSVTTSDTRMHVAFAWLRPVSVSGTGHTGTVTAGANPNESMVIKNPSGSTVDSSNITNSSSEYCCWNVTGNYGTYTAQVSRTDSGSNSFKYAFAWR